jgi:exopolysaccharide production protein ExoZ
VISGFIIWTVASRDEQRPAVFFWRRFTRVAPAYWLATAVVAVIAAVSPMFLPQVSLSPRHLLLSLAFIQHTDPNGLVFPVLPPGWSLNYEAVFYAMVTLVLFAPQRLRFGLILAALAAEVAFGFADPPVYGLGANPMMLQFAAGVWLAHRGQRGRRIEPGAGAVFIVLGAAIFAAMGLSGFRNEFFRPFLWGLPAVMIVAGALALEGGPRLRPPPALVRLGDASYAIYLCHLPIVALVAHTMGARYLGLFVPAAMLASIAAGLAFHHLIERPLIRGFRALPGRLGQAQADPSR